MSMLSKAIDRYIAKKGAKHGIKGAIIWFIGVVVKATPTKKDDVILVVVKEALKKF